MLGGLRGTVDKGQIKLTTPVDLPDGSEVRVWVESANLEPHTDELEAPPEGNLASDPAIGMWADREDMKDSVAWLAEQRAKWWRPHSTRQD